MKGYLFSVVKLESLDGDRTSRFVVHSMQLLPHTAFRSHEAHRMLSLSEHGVQELPFAVQGTTLLFYEPLVGESSIRADPIPSTFQWKYPM